jgi:hypothetical protein
MRCCHYDSGRKCSHGRNASAHSLEGRLRRKIEEHASEKAAEGALLRKRGVVIFYIGVRTSLCVVPGTNLVFKYKIEISKNTNYSNL